MRAGLVKKTVENEVLAEADTTNEQLEQASVAIEEDPDTVIGDADEEGTEINNDELDTSIVNSIDGNTLSDSVGLNEKIDSMNQIIATLKAQKQDSTLTISQLNNQCTSFKNKVDSLENEVRLLNNTIKEHSKYSVASKAQIDDLELVNNNLRMTHKTQIDEFEDKLSTMNSRHKVELENLSSNFKTQEETLLTQISSLKSNQEKIIADGKDAISKLQMQLDDTIASKDHIIANMKIEFGDSESALKGLCDSFKAQYSNMEAKYNELIANQAVTIEEANRNLVSGHLDQLQQCKQELLASTSQHQDELIRLTESHFAATKLLEQRLMDIKVVNEDNVASLNSKFEQKLNDISDMHAKQLELMKVELSEQTSSNSKLVSDSLLAKSKLELLELELQQANATVNKLYKEKEDLVREHMAEMMSNKNNVDG